VRGPVIPLTFPKLIDPGVTPVSDAVLPVVPAQSAASAAGVKLNPADDGEGAAAGAADVVPPAAARPVAARPAVEDPVAPAAEATPVLAAAVVVVAAAVACCERVGPLSVAPRYGLTRAPHEAARNATASNARPAVFLPTTHCPPVKASR
jgi:hypothetical protein